VGRIFQYAVSIVSIAAGILLRRSSLPFGKHSVRSGWR
jgi:hypothetical protein